MIGRSTILLLRIPFSFFLMPVFLFALSQSGVPDPVSTVIVFVVLHLFIYPASNGYNSFMDKDTGSIGGLKKPPAATKELFFATLLLDACGLALSLLVNNTFFFCVLIYMLASKAYSYRGIRLKQYPLAGFFTVMFFQGGFTFWMVYKSITLFSFFDMHTLKYALLASSLLIAGVYPLTQVYQHEADAKDGVRTISMRLGYRGTFLFTMLMFVSANIVLYHYFSETEKPQHFWYFQAFLLPVVAYFLYWMRLVWKDKRYADFEHTMRMNLLASSCMSACFILITILNQLA